MERVVGEAFRYELVGEDGQAVGDLATTEEPWEAGDLVPFGGGIFEILTVEGPTCSVRKIL